VRRTSLMAVPAALLLLAGCGLGEGAPHPGVAAQVDGSTLTLAQLDTLVDAICVVDAANPQGQPSSRGQVATQQVTDWVRNHVILTYAGQHGVSAPRSTPDLTGTPGWDELTADEQDALVQVVADGGQVQTVAKDPAVAAVEPSGMHIVINPEFGLQAGASGVTGLDTSLSVPVSDEATAGAKLTAEQIAALPDSQLCGRRPVPGAQPAQ
jgi:hypothetical protein